MARRPSYALAWLGVLLVPAFLATLPLDLVLGDALDLRPAATRLVTAPTHDVLWLLLSRQQPALPAAALGSTLLTLLLAIPLAWFVSGFVTQAVRGETQPAAYVGARAIAVAMAGLPLRVIVWAAAALAAAPAVGAMTPHARLYPAIVAALLYALASPLVTVLGDYARTFSFAEPDRGLLYAWRTALRCARARPTLTLALALFELALGVLAFAPALLARPLGVYSLATGVLAVLALVLRASGTVVGIAAATGAASRSA